MADKLTSEALELKLRRLGQKIFEIEQSQALIEKSSAKFRLLYENFPLPSQSLDSDGYFIEVNPAWLDLLFPIFGYTQMILDDLPEDSPFRSSPDEIFAAGIRVLDEKQAAPIPGALFKGHR